MTDSDSAWSHGARHLSDILAAKCREPRSPTELNGVSEEHGVRLSGDLALVAELGVISAKGRNGTAELLEIIAKDEDDRISRVARLSLTVLARQYAAITTEIGTIEKQIHALHRSCEESRRLAEIPGVGPIVATALIAEVGDWTVFSSGRSLAAWIGLVPRQHSTGGKDRLGRISTQGNRHLRWLLVAGSMAVIRYARQHGTKRLWLVRLMGRRPVNVGRHAFVGERADCGEGRDQASSPARSAPELLLDLAKIERAG